MAPRRSRAGSLAAMALAVVGCTADTAPDANPAGQGTTFTPAVSTTVPLATSNAPGQTGTTRSFEEVFCQQPPLAPGADDMVVTVYQICGVGEGSRSRMLAGLQPVERVTAQTDDPLRAAMEALLAGPTRMRPPPGSAPGSRRPRPVPCSMCPSQKTEGPRLISMATPLQA
jgi:hypothetical protein